MNDTYNIAPISGTPALIGVSLLTISCVINLLLGGLVLSRNPRSRPGRLFALFTLVVTAWLATNYFTNNPLFGAATTDIINRSAYVLGFAAALCSLFFTYTFPRHRRIHRWELILLIFVAVPMLLLSWTNAIAGTVVIAHGIYAYSTAPLADVYVAAFVLFIGMSIHNLLSGYRTMPRQLRRQTVLVLSAFGGTEVIALSINVILPYIKFSQQINHYTPLLTLLLVGSISYAIIRHRLFDIRWVIARSLGYVLAVSAVAIGYGALVFGIAQLIFKLRIDLAAQIFLALGTGLAGLIFQRFQKGFNRLTNRIFYQDAYDTQALFDELNRVLVSNIELETLLSRTSALISRELKSEFCGFMLRAQTGPSYRALGNGKFTALKHNSELMRKLSQRHTPPLVAIDYLEEPQRELKELLTEERVAVAVRFAPDARRKDRSGYMLLGYKKSGNPYSNQDLRVLDTIANELVIAIQNALHFEEIQNFNDTLQARVDHATRELRKTNDKLQELDATKDDFISMASHQLRTPLTSVKGYLSMLLDGDGGHLNSAQRRMLSQAFISSQRMVFLIADLLNVSRLKTGKFILEPRVCNLSKMIQEEMGQLKETAKAREISVEFKPPATFPDLTLDETKTRQVIMNFMDNAIYYTRAGGHIQVELTNKPANIELRVVDDGIGVPKAEQRHLFTKFYRAGNARQARPDGTGLGLFMAKKVVLAQGGSIIFESIENKGSTFGFVFPKARHLAAPAESPTIRQPATAR